MYTLSIHWKPQKPTTYCDKPARRRTINQSKQYRAETKRTAHSQQLNLFRSLPSCQNKRRILKDNIWTRKWGENNPHTIEIRTFTKWSKFARSNAGALPSIASVFHTLLHHLDLKIHTIKLNAQQLPSLRGAISTVPASADLILIVPPIF